MGCPICLDSFGEDAERGTRPVALPCGHVFHKACSDGWLRTCRDKGDAANCPLCKKELGSLHALSLWPSDVSDLDMYIKYRSQRIEHQRNHVDRRPAPAAVALDRYMSRDAQSRLLGKLMDFRQHVSAYVMAVNNVHMSSCGGEDRIYRLFKDTAKRDDSENEVHFKNTLEALSEATSILSDSIIAADKTCASYKEKQQAANENLEKSEAMRTAFQKHMETKASEEQAMQQERDRNRRLTLHVKKELQEIERRKENMERERQAYINHAREKETEAMKARLQSAQSVAESRGDAEQKVNELNKYVEEQERLRVAAEDRARDEKKRANWLADRNRLLSSKLDVARNDVKQMRAQLAAGHGAATAAKGKAKAHEAEAEEGDPASASENDDEQVSGDKVKKEDSKAALCKPEDWDIESNNLDALRQTLSQHDGYGDDDVKTIGIKRRPRLSANAVVIEDDDLDAELDDDAYPMPAFRRTASSSRIGSAVLRSGTSSSSYATATSRPNAWDMPDTSSSSGGLILPGGFGSSGAGRRSRLRNGEDDDDLDDSVELISVKRPRGNNSTSDGSLSTRQQPRRSVSGGGGGGMSNMIADNDTLMDRIMTGGRNWLAPRRRAR